MTASLLPAETSLGLPVSVALWYFVLMNLPLKHMTAEEFAAWAMRQETGRYELIDGVVVAMNAERLEHARAKTRILFAFMAAIERSGVMAEALPDGVAIKINNRKVYEPDCLVRCGTPLGGEVVLVTDPVIVVEVLSPSTGPVDLSDKLIGYFTVPTIQHYLIANLNNRLVLHYSRSPDGEPTMKTIRRGEIDLDPPGLKVAVDSFFPQ